MFPFLMLPYELRLEIYEYLLISPDPVIVSPRRKQLNVGVETVIQGNIYLRAPRPKPSKRVFHKKDHRPYVHLLRACRQTNDEGTPILYGKNRFLVGRKWQLCIRLRSCRGEMSDRRDRRADPASVQPHSRRILPDPVLPLVVTTVHAQRHQVHHVSQGLLLPRLGGL
jgi:hypothetical protein